MPRYGIFQDTFGTVTPGGNIAVLPGASVEVRREDDNSLVSIYADKDGGETKPNPFNANDDGFAFFYVRAGRYRINATSGTTTLSLRNVEIFDAVEVADEAAASADLAEEWATSLEVVANGLRGSRYYAQQSSDSADAASTSETNASNSEGAAQSSANAAQSSANAAATSETNASNSEGAAAPSASTAEDWATSLGVVANDLRGARYYAQQASDVLSGKADVDGNYANLRARATTKGDVGLGSVQNVDTTKSNNVEFDNTGSGIGATDVEGAIKETRAAAGAVWQ